MVRMVPELAWVFILGQETQGKRPFFLQVLDILKTADVI